MNKCTSETSFLVLFNQGLQAHLPLGVSTKLSDPKLNISFSIIMGENDWMRHCDDDYG
jgi:hypothetical protein